MTNGQRLDGKVAVITGATGGIGAASAQTFLGQGAKVMLVGRSRDKLEATLQNLGGGKNIAYAVAEADNEAQTAAAVQAAVETFGGVDILLANAGTEGKASPIENQSYETWQHVLNVNVIGVWLSMKYCVEPMKARGGGSMIVISSTAGLRGTPGFSPYAASKHAVYGLVKSSALELAKSGVRVNAIGPGPINNRMMRSLEEQMAPGGGDAVRSAMEKLIPMRRYGVNEEVANMALFLASDESSFSTGSIHMVDGGYVTG